jgi:formate hydrogenlyase subunit 6/NADH:ubiquinone oxidoreductase subunit I
MIPYKDGLTIPEVTPDICVGCGGCEYICPVLPKAIFVEGNAVQKEAKVAQQAETIIMDDDIGFGF